MHRISILLLGMLSFALGGCVGSLNRKEAQIHYHAAQRFDLQGDFESARNQYGRALVNARLAKADAATISMLTYNYGRTSGYVCRLDEAEKNLLAALEMEKEITGADSPVSSMRLFELARFYFDQDNFEKSVAFYARGIPAVDRMGIAKEDPIGFADAIYEYASALRATGKDGEANAAKQKADQLRESNKDLKACFIPVRYKCKAG